MDLEAETGFIFSLSDDGLMTLVLVKEDDAWTVGMPKVVTTEQAKIALGHLFFGGIVLYLLLFTRSARAMQQPSGSGLSGSGVVSALPVQRTVREYHLPQSVQDEERSQLFLKKKKYLSYAFQFDTSRIPWNIDGTDCTEKPLQFDNQYRVHPDHPDIQAEVLSRGIQNFIGSPEINSNLWRINSRPDLESASHRLTWLVKFREQVVLPYIEFVDNLESSQGNRDSDGRPLLSRAGLEIEELTDFTISTAMKALAYDIVSSRPLIADVPVFDRSQQYRNRVQRTYLKKILFFKNKTETLITQDQKVSLPKIKTLLTEEAPVQVQKVSPAKLTFKLQRSSPAQQKTHSFRRKSQLVPSSPVQFKLRSLRSKMKYLIRKRQLIECQMQLAKLEMQPARLKIRTLKLSSPQLDIKSAQLELKSVRLKILAIKSEI